MARSVFFLALFALVALGFATFPVSIAEHDDATTLSEPSDITASVKNSSSGCFRKCRIKFDSCKVNCQRPPKCACKKKFEKCKKKCKN